MVKFHIIIHVEVLKYRFANEATIFFICLRAPPEVEIRRSIELIYHCSNQLIEFFRAFTFTNH